MRIVFGLLLIFAVGCGENPTPDAQMPFHEKDCVKDDFAFDFYTNHDQGRIIYCYAQLQAIARQYAQEHPERFK
jgi:hypothetical protein